MDLVSNSEVLHRREYLAKRIGNLCHGRYLPVKVPAVNLSGDGTRVSLTEKHPYMLVRELDLGIVEPEALCCAHKLRETWNGKRELLEELNLQLFEARGSNPTNNRFQVSANASEPK